MKQLIVCIFFFLLLPCQLIVADNSTKHSTVDSVLNMVVRRAPFYCECISEYYSDMYVKAHIHVPKKNVLINLFPFMFNQQKNVSEYMMESFSELHYTAPNIYDQRIKAYHGTVVDMKDFREELIDFFQINVYSNTLLNSKLVSPLSPMAKRYYTYNIDSLYNDKENRRTYQVSFTPKNKSYQLVEGYMLVSDSAWSVRELYFKGRSEYMTFSNRLYMGEVATEMEYLPIRYNMSGSFHFLGNKVDGDFMADFDYKSIKFYFEDKPVTDRKKKYDLTESYTLQTDTADYLRLNNTAFDQLRPVPLSAHEAEYYHKYEQDRVIERKQINTKLNSVFWGNVEDLFIKNHIIRIPKAGSIRFSEVLNPLLLSYSGTNGLAYRHKIRYKHTFAGDRLLQLHPTIGYNFKFKELYWQIPASWYYWPKKRASLHFDIGNGNRIYGSGVLNELKEMPDSIFDFNKIQLDYYRNFYVDFTHRFEMVNGLSIDIGFSSRKRSAIKRSDTIPAVPGIGSTNKYVSFAPRLRVEWTPKLYYYKSGNRKVNLYSRWPTFSFDYERGVKGFLGGDGEYERMEIDMQHHIPLGLMRNLYYRIGAGAFTDQEDMYFVDFANFSKSNLPTGWNDDIGGVFQLLDRRWYNASRKYARANITYEAPFLIMPFLLEHMPNVLNERIYVGVLSMPHLHPYIELGYGIGTHIFDFGVFANNINGKFEDVGVKFTIELFNR